MKIFFTSDNHFGHKNIMNFCPNTRKGKDVDEMDQLMIAAWQSQVKPEDVVYLLGDVFFCRAERALAILDQLPGQKFLVYGNHDKVIKSNSTLRNKFVSVADYRELDLKTENFHKRKVVLFHFPMYEWNRMHHGSYHLFGHIHSPYGLIPHPAIPGRAMDVGIDSRPNADMTLWSWAEVEANLNQRDVRAHHEKKVEDNG